MCEKIINNASERLEKYAWTLTHPWNKNLLVVKTLNSLIDIHKNKEGDVIDKNSSDYESIRDFISNCNYFSVLSFNMPRHTFDSLDEFESILNPLIILYYVDREFTDEEREEESINQSSNNIFNLNTQNQVLKAKYIIGDFEFTKSFEPKRILCVEDFLLSDSIENIENASFYEMNLNYSENIKLNASETQILLSEKNNKIIEFSLGKLLNEFTQKSFDYVQPDSLEFHNNTIVMTGDHYHEGYLKEHHYAASIWLHINKNSVLHKETANSNYNGR